MKGREAKKGMVLATTIVLMLVIVALSVLIIVIASSSVQSARLASDEADRAIALDLIGNEFLSQVYDAPLSDEQNINEKMNSFIDATKYTCTITKIGSSIFIMDIMSISESKLVLSVAVEVESIIDSDNYSVNVKSWSCNEVEVISADINAGLLALKSKFLSLAEERVTDKNEEMNENTAILIGFTKKYFADNKYPVENVEDGYKVFDISSSQLLYYVQIVNIAKDDDEDKFNFMLVVADQDDNYGTILLKTTLTREMKNGKYELIENTEIPAEVTES